MNKVLAAFALLLLISFTLYSWMKVEQENDSLRHQVAGLQTKINKLTLWQEDAERMEPWLKLTREKMSKMKRLEIDALVK